MQKMRDEDFDLVWPKASPVEDEDNEEYEPTQKNQRDGDNCQNCQCFY